MSSGFDAWRIFLIYEKEGDIEAGLGLMWAIAFTVAPGSYTFMALSLVGHTVLIAAAAITVVTWTTATLKPGLFLRGFSNRKTSTKP